MTLIVVRGVPEFITRLTAAGVVGDAALQAVIDGIGNEVARQAKEIVPVVSGDLQDSITYDNGRVYTAMPYARAVEFGGPHNDPKPYLRPAADTADETAGLAAGKAVMDSA